MAARQLYKKTLYLLSFDSTSPFGILLEN